MKLETPTSSTEAPRSNATIQGDRVEAFARYVSDNTSLRNSTCWLPLP